MAGRRFTIEHSEVIGKLAGPTPTLSATASEGMKATWLDERGEAIEDADLDEVVLPPSEWPGRGRTIKTKAGERLVLTRTSAPDDARSIRFSGGGRTATFAAGPATDQWHTERTTRHFGSNEERYEVRIFSELFTDFDRFEQMVASLYNVLVEVAPFSRVAADGRLRLVGHFARSTAPDGHFRTVARDAPGDRRIYGDRQYAQDRLKPAFNAMPALILIDSSKSGGAGGALWRGRPYWPAWASLGSKTAKATWQAVAIHELAHGFGLSDEYVDPLMKGKDLPEKYPNVSNAALASALDWNDLAGLPGSTQLPTYSDTGVPKSGLERGRTVAAYQGAFYTDRDWRPSLSCRMRDYDSAGFCPVCSRIILKMYGMNAD